MSRHGLSKAARQCRYLTSALPGAETSWSRKRPLGSLVLGASVLGRPESVRTLARLHRFIPEKGSCSSSSAEATLHRRLVQNKSFSGTDVARSIPESAGYRSVSPCKKSTWLVPRLCLRPIKMARPVAKVGGPWKRSDKQFQREIRRKSGCATPGLVNGMRLYW